MSKKTKAADSYVVPAWIGTSGGSPTRLKRSPGVCIDLVGYSLRPPDIEDPNFDEALLAESPEDLGGSERRLEVSFAMKNVNASALSGVGIRPPSGPSKRTNGAKVEGLALLKEAWRAGETGKRLCFAFCFRPGPSLAFTFTSGCFVLAAEGCEGRKHSGIAGRRFDSQTLR